MSNTKQQKYSSDKAPPEFKTHGEKMYDLVFNQGINFWANLIVSAGFTYWVNHSRVPIMKNPPGFAKWLGNAPIKAQSAVRNGIHDMPFMNLFGEKMAAGGIKQLEAVENGVDMNKRMKVSKFMADALTLTSAGTFIMIPGVWGAQKFKGDFVRWQDKMHYGQDAEHISWVHDAHDRIDQDKKVTLLGYGVGRLGSMAAVQAAAYTVGHGDAVKWIGNKTGIKILQKFEGIDHFAGTVGDTIGSAAAKTFKTAATRINDGLTERGIDWSLEQRRYAYKVLHDHESLDSVIAHMEPEAVNTMEREAKLISSSPTNPTAADKTTYNRAVQDFGKYVGLDTMYTAVTAGTIVPFVDWLKDHVPGMAYTTAPKHQEKPKNRVTSVQREAVVDTSQLETARS